MTTEAIAELTLPFIPYGGNYELFHCKDREVLVEGGAGTGKTRAILEKLHLVMQKYPGARGLILRKTLIALTNSALVTFQKEVLHPSEGVKFFGGSKARPAAFQYPNGSEIAVGGMDDPTKVLSTFYDIVFVNEATELSVQEWETINGRIRAGKIAHMQLIGDCNPAHDSHWLNRRCQQGKTTRIRTVHQDNPAYFNRDGTPTRLGEEYMAVLDGMTDDRRRRFFLGEWVGMENAIYPMLDAKVHLHQPDKATVWSRGSIGVDYGRKHRSAVVAIQEDSTGQLWVRECIYLEGGDAEAIRQAVASQKLRFHIRKVRTDPTVGYAASDLGGEVADGQAKARRGRIAIVTSLLGHDAERRIQPTMLFVKDGRGIAKPDKEGLPCLWDELQGYHWLERSTETGADSIVDRTDDDGVAAMEYAVEQQLKPVSVYQPTVATAPRVRSKTFRVGAA